MPEQTEDSKASKRASSSPAPIIMDLGQQEQSGIDDLVKGEGGAFQGRAQCALLHSF